LSETNLAMSTPAGTTLLLTEDIDKAAESLRGIAIHTPLMQNHQLSEEYNTEIRLKREDLQVVRSYKIRGAYNKIQNLPETETRHGVVCASAGNHAQGVAYACFKKQIKGTIFMPETTSEQKVKQVKMFGKEWVELKLTGDTFDDSFQKARMFSDQHGAAFIHPFDDPEIIAGQGTVGKEILDDAAAHIDFLIVPVGGGGLASGVGSYFNAFSPETVIIGVEPEGAPAMKTSIENGSLVTLDHIDKFVDGAAVKKAGNITFEICRNVLDRVITVPEGKICSTILKLYNEQAIVVEPAGALSIAALDTLQDEIRDSNVVCVVSGSNNDITRMAEIKERSLMYEGLKHYFIVDFPQRAGALREFLNKVLAPGDDITYFEYSKKTNRESGPALIGLEIKQKEDLQPLIDRMEQQQIRFEYINEQPSLFRFLT